MNPLSHLQRKTSGSVRAGLARIIPGGEVRAPGLRHSGSASPPRRLVTELSALGALLLHFGMSSVLAVPALEDIRDIKPIAPAQASVWWWLLPALLLAALAAWLLWRRKQKNKSESKTPLIPPHIRALERLESARGLMREPRAFGIAVSDAIRLYLEERFHFHAPERTTEEFMEELQGSELLSDGHKGLLEKFLAHCDLVKFARYQPEWDELEGLLASAFQLVKETEPSPAPSEPAPSEPAPLELEKR
jgi:hypothetical protein